MESDSSNPSIAVLLPGRLDDGGWVEAAAQAIESLRRSRWQVTAIPQPHFAPENALPATEKLAIDGIDLIIGHGHEYIETFLELAPAYPQSCFFAMDKLTVEQTWPKNLCCLYQRQDEAAYLCGRLSAHMTGHGRVGFVGGMEVPTQLANGRAFERGARSLNHSIEVVSEYAGSFENPQRGHELALRILDQGADVLMHTASETGNGVIEACNQRGAYVIGYTLDQRNLAPQWMLTSLVVDVTNIYKKKIREVEAGRFRPGVWLVGLAEEMVGLAPLSSAVPESATNDVNQVKQAIVAGAISV